MRQFISRTSRRWPSAVALLIVMAFTATSARAATVFNNWSSGGPFPAPSKAKVTTLLVTPTTPTPTVLAGTDGGGIYTMPEGGSSWSPLNSGLLDRSVRSLAVHPVDPQQLYAATSSGVFKSGNGGLAWSASSTGLGSSDVRGLAVDPQTPTVLYAATAAGVFKSVDGGGSWSSANTGLTSLNVRALLIDPTTTASLYAATDQGVFVSTNAAGSWSAAAALPTSDTLSLAWAATTPSPTVLAGTNGSGIYASTDGGASWNSDNASLGNLTAYAVLVDNPTNPTMAYAATANGVYKQQYNSGAWNSWAAAGSSLPTPAVVQALANDPVTRTTLFAGTNFGVYRSTNSGGSWSAVSGLKEGRAIAVKPTDSTVMVAGFGGGGIYLSSDSGGSWTASPDANASWLFVTSLLYDPSGSPLYAGTGNGVFKSTDDGASWTDISATLANRDVRTLSTGGGYTLIAGTGAGVFVWNGAGTWSAYPGGEPTNLEITSLAWRGSSLFAGTNGGGVFRSDSGGSWSQLITGLTSTVVSSLAVDAANVYAGTSAGVFRSADNGATWTAASSGINFPIRSLTYSGGTPSFLTAGTGGGGVFFSTNSGDVWTAMNTGLTDLTVNALSASAATKKVFATGPAKKVFGLNLSPVSTATPAAPLAASPLNVGAINVGDTKSTVLTLQNSGTLQLRISALTLGGTDQALYAVVAGGGRPCDLTTLPTLTIEAGDYCTVAVNFTPTSSGTKTASLSIYSNAPNQPVLEYLSGKGAYPPQATIVTPAGGATVRNPVAVTGTALDFSQADGVAGSGSTLAKVQVSVDGGATWNDAAKNATLNTWTQWSYSWTATPLPANGAYAISARAIDTNGYTQTVLSTVNITVDNTPPVTTITSKPKLLDNSAAGQFTITVSKAGSTSQCQIDTGAFVACGSPFSYSGLTDGNHTFSVLSTDTIGNVESSAKSYSWTIDTVPPTANIDTVPALITPLNNATFAFSANEANSTFLCTLDGVSAPCASPISFSNLADGNHLFSVQATDPAGNTSPSAPTTKSYSWIVDKNDMPTSTLNVPLAPLSGSSFLFTGAATDRISGVRVVNISINGGSATPTIDSSASPALPWSSWGYLWALPLNGTYSVQVQAIDQAGNPQTVPASGNIIVANPLPDCQLSSPANGALVGSATPRVITGTAQAATGGLPLQKVQVAVFPTATPPASPAWTDASGSTNWTYNWQFPADGSYTIQARVLDTATNLAGAVIGNPSPIISRNVIVDTTPPVSTVTPLANPYITGHLIMLAGTADDPNSGTGVRDIAVTLSGPAGSTVTGTASYSSATKSWSYTSPQLADGLYQVQIAATDNAGNPQLIPATTAVTLDNVPPVTTIAGVPALLSNLPLASFSLQANEPASFTCTLDGVTAPCVCNGGSTSTTCIQSYSGLANGAHSFSVVAKDLAGNVETAPKSYSWSVDVVPPTVSAVTPADGSKRLSVAGTLVTITFSKDIDPSTLTPATFYLDHGATGTIGYDAATHTATLTPAGRLSYTTTYTVTASSGIKDFAGNSLATYTWTFATDPDGDVNLDGKVDIADALLCLQMAVGVVTPTAEQLRHGDLAPFKNGKPLPDGKIDASDAMMILQKVVGNVAW
ncbi:Ig-like domain-containing protein [Geomonas sp. Red276]